MLKKKKKKIERRDVYYYWHPSEQGAKIHSFIFISHFILIRAAMNPDSITGHHVHTHPHTPTHSFTPNTQPAQVHVSGQWEETREPRGNPCERREKMNNSTPTSDLHNSGP